MTDSEGYALGLFVGSAAVYVPFLWFLMRGWNAIRLNRKYELHFRPSGPEEFQALDLERLKALSRHFLEAGFTPLGDFAVEATYGEPPQGVAAPAPLSDPVAKETSGSNSPAQIYAFERVFVHHGYSCVGRIRDTYYVVKASGRISRSDSVAIESWTGSEDSSWTYVTLVTSGAPAIQGHLKLQRSPRALYTVMPTGTAPAGLLAVHLDRRQKIAAAAGLNWDRNPTLESWLAMRLAGTRERRAQYAKWNPFSLFARAVALVFDRKTEWFGELEGRV